MTKELLNLDEWEKQKKELIKYYKNKLKIKKKAEYDRRYRANSVYYHWVSNKKLRIDIEFYGYKEIITNK